MATASWTTKVAVIKDRVIGKTVHSLIKGSRWGDVGRGRWTGLGVFSEGPPALVVNPFEEQKDFHPLN